MHDARDARRCFDLFGCSVLCADHVRPSSRPCSFSSISFLLPLPPRFPMNSLYTLGVRQTNSIQADLERLRNGDTSAALLGLHPLSWYPDLSHHDYALKVVAEDPLHNSNACLYDLRSI